MIDNDRSITAKSISKKLLSFHAFRRLCGWVGPRNTAVCLLFKSPPCSQWGLQLAFKFMTGLRQKPTDRRGTQCSECHCHGLIHNLLFVAQTAVSQQHQLNSRAAAFKNAADLHRALIVGCSGRADTLNDKAQLVSKHHVGLLQVNLCSSLRTNVSNFHHVRQ